MGNCLFGGMGDGDQSVIRVATSNGGVMEFHAPTTVESITDEFPGHGIFRTHDLFWKPLPHSQVLLSGESYHLIPLDAAGGMKAAARMGHVRSNSAPQRMNTYGAPYRMSFESRGMTTKRPYGFWKVKLVISTEQLLEILSEEEKTEELIESMRTVAKCGNVFSAFSSDQWSMYSSRNAASSHKDANLLDF